MAAKKKMHPCTICGKKVIPDMEECDYVMYTPNGDAYDLVCEECQEELQRALNDKIIEMQRYASAFRKVKLIGV